ncbi:MAG: sulfotransferase, partial [Pseudomonadota bacterium]
MKPTLIGIGAQKCASSWAHTALGAHPDITGSDPKEIDYFSYYFDRGHAWYEAHFPEGTAHRFEISPSYFHDPRAPERLAAYAPEAKILVLLRDPVERAFSNHLHEVAKGHIPAIPFAEGL